MASLSMQVVYWAFLLSLRTVVQAAIVTYDFNIGWVTANPDGAFERPTMGVNGQWPIPHITATVGDEVVVNVKNDLGNQSTSLHFHGLYMNGTAHMDGPVGVSQCSIPPGGSFTYKFNISQPGTYWYHSHVTMQYPDGLRGALIVNDPDSPYKDDYDEEVVLTLSDWYHDQMPGLLAGFLRFSNPTGAEPVPDAALMNDTQDLRIPVQPGKTYMFRIINMAAFAAQYLWFEGHTMRIVEVDGIYTKPAEASMIYLTAAQRYSVLVTTKVSTESNFAVMGSMDQDLFDVVPEGLNPNVTGWLVYDQSKDLPEAALVDEFDPFDDFTLVPADGEELYADPDHSIQLDVKMDNLGDGANYAFFNEITYVRPKVPTLYSVLSTGASAANASIYGQNVNPFVLKKNDIIEIVLNNNDPGKHPFHLHGHAFQTVVRSAEEAGPYVANETFPQVPMKRDTVMLTCLSAYLRVWLFHCHIEWHVASGLTTTFIEDPLGLQSSLQIPQDHLDTCAAQKVAVKGNAAGNMVDVFDLTGESKPHAPLPSGFTGRGIVALVFSIISAFLGVAVISWYGAGEMGKKKS